MSPDRQGAHDLFDQARSQSVHLLETHGPPDLVGRNIRKAGQHLRYFLKPPMVSPYFVHCWISSSK